MNEQRRKRLSKIKEKLNGLLDEVAEIKDDEQNAFDNLPESIQGSERGERMSEIIDSLDEVYDSIEAAADNISEAIE